MGVLPTHMTADFGGTALPSHAGRRFAVGIAGRRAAEFRTVVRIPIDAEYMGLLSNFPHI